MLLLGSSGPLPYYAKEGWSHSDPMSIAIYPTSRDCNLPCRFFFKFPCSARLTVVLALPCYLVRRLAFERLIALCTPALFCPVLPCPALPYIMGYDWDDKKDVCYKMYTNTNVIRAIISG